MRKPEEKKGKKRKTEDGKREGKNSFFKTRRYPNELV